MEEEYFYDTYYEDEEREFYNTLNSLSEEEWKQLSG